jgi:hypothetical protein
MGHGQEHLVIYLRLLDADAEGADWQRFWPSSARRRTSLNFVCLPSGKQLREPGRVQVSYPVVGRMRTVLHFDPVSASPPR